MKKYSMLACLAILASGSAMATTPKYDPIAKVNQVNSGLVTSRLQLEQLSGGKNVDTVQSAGNTVVVKSGHLKANQTNSGRVDALNYSNSLTGSNNLVTNAAGNAIAMGSKDDKPKANITQKNSGYISPWALGNQLKFKDTMEAGTTGNNVNLTSGKLKANQVNFNFVAVDSWDNVLEGTNEVSTDAYGNQIVMGSKSKDPKAKITQNNKGLVYARTLGNTLTGDNKMDTVGAGNTVTLTNGKLKANQENEGFVRSTTQANVLTGANVAANYGAGNAITMGN